MMTIQQAFNALIPLKADAHSIYMQCWQHDTSKPEQVLLSYQVSVHKNGECRLYADGLLENAVHKALLAGCAAQVFTADHEAVRRIAESTRSNP